MTQQSETPPIQGNLDRPALAVRLREYREYAGYSQEDVANFLGVSRSAVSLMESGNRRVEALELQRLANLYRCRMEELIGEGAHLDESLNLVARATAALSEDDRREVLRFAEYLRTRGDSETN